MIEYNTTPLSTADNFVNTSNDSLLKKALYIILGILPASFFSLLSLLLIGGTFLPLIFIIATFCGTSGLYIITFSKEHDFKFEFILLIMGQLAMLVVIGFIILSVISSGNLSLDSILYLGLTKPYELIISIIILIILFGPIAVALHYQLTTYKWWKLSKVKSTV